MNGQERITLGHLVTNLGMMNNTDPIVDGITFLDSTTTQHYPRFTHFCGINGGNETAAWSRYYFHQGSLRQ